MKEFGVLVKKIVSGKDLTAKEAFFALEQMTLGKATQAQTGSFLAGLKMKGESVGEVLGFCMFLRKKSIKVAFRSQNLVDCAGTGGDNAGTFNISTCSAFVAGAAGAVVAKHGSRSASGSFGSADVLDELSVKMCFDSKQTLAMLKKNGLAFLFAPSFHPALKSVAGLRKELSFRTIFNLVGPLVNPINPKRQLIGVSDKRVLPKMAKVLKRLGTQKTLLVNSDLDEFSIFSPNIVFEVSGKKTKKYSLYPADFGFKGFFRASILAKGKRESAGIILSVLKGKHGAPRDIVLFNSGVLLYASGLAPGIKQGILAAEKAIDSEKALSKLEESKGVQ